MTSGQPASLPAWRESAGTHEKTIKNQGFSPTPLTRILLPFHPVRALATAPLAPYFFVYD